MKKERKHIAVNYTREQSTRLVTFCGIINKPLADFTAQALDNEMAYAIEQMPAERQMSVKEILGVE